MRNTILLILYAVLFLLSMMGVVAHMRRAWRLVDPGGEPWPGKGRPGRGSVPAVVEATKRPERGKEAERMGDSLSL